MGNDEILLCVTNMHVMLRYYKQLSLNVILSLNGRLIATSFQMKINNSQDPVIGYNDYNAPLITLLSHWNSDGPSLRFVTPVSSDGALTQLVQCDSPMVADGRLSSIQLYILNRDIVVLDHHYHALKTWWVYTLRNDFVHQLFVLAAYGRLPR